MAFSLVMLRMGVRCNESGEQREWAEREVEELGAGGGGTHHVGLIMLSGGQQPADHAPLPAAAAAVV